MREWSDFFKTDAADLESIDLTTFGRYKFKRYPFWLLSAPADGRGV